TYTYTYAYDLRGNQLEQSKYYNSSLSEKITSTYFNDGRIRSQITRGANNYKKSEVIYYDSGAYDAVGNLRKYRYLSYKSNGSYDYTHTYTYNYQTRNGEYKQNGINVTSTKSGYTTGRSNVQ